MRPTPYLFAAALVLLPAPLGAQAAEFELTIPSIMRGPEVVGREPSNVRWTADGRWIHFEWVEPGTDWRQPLEPYRVRAEPGAVPERLDDVRMDTLGPLAAPGTWSRDRRWKAVAWRGDLYLLDAREGGARRLTRTAAAEGDPQITPDGTRVLFTRDNNAYAVELGTGLVRQLTDLRPGPAPEDTTPTGQRGALDAQQRRLFEAIRDRRARDSTEKAERLAREARVVRPVYLGKDEKVAGLSVAPDGRSVILRTTTPTTKDRDTKVPAYVTASGYTDELTARPKVGDARDATRIGVLAVEGEGGPIWLDPFPADSGRIPAELRVVGWNDAATAALLFAVSEDYKTRILYRVEADSGRLAPVEELTDSAWVGGPCLWCAGWLPGDQGIWYVSEADGWAHLYTADSAGGGRSQRTFGRWEVLGAELLPDRAHFLLHTSEASPFERHVYRMPVEGGPRERLTSSPGGHSVEPSPDGAWLADVFSQANRPPDLHLQRTRAGVASTRLTTSPTTAWLTHRWIVPEIVWIPASDGARVPARIYRPKDVGAEPNGAGVVFVHGAGYLHNVHNYWSSYYREYMFHHLLASRGYVVLDLDFRGSAGYGRDWRTAVYRHMGGLDLQDQVDASRYLGATFGIPPERVGIYGGSYGGFITLMALFTEARWFGAGAALRSVTDWAHYNHWYTGRILSLPQEDSTAYLRSSPIYFAEGLEDPLLIAHGVVDVNVQVQDVVRLAQRLIELGKEGWELALYPVEDHGFVRPSSWTDEYRRIFALFERHLR